MAAMIAPAVHAGTFSIDLNPPNNTGTLYGNPPVNQSNVPPGNGANSCAPTAVANSLTYLTNAFPTIYGNMLLQDKATAGGPANPQPNNNTGWTAIATQLASANYMMTSATGGTSEANIVSGTTNYVNNNAPGTTLFELSDNPAASFILNELTRREDLEIGILPTVAGQIGHVLTVSSTSGTTDANGNITSMSIDGTDPAGGTFNIPLTIGGGPQGQLSLTYGGNPYYVAFGFGQSPIPEPATLTLMVIGVGGAAILFRRPRRGR